MWNSKVQHWHRELQTLFCFCPRNFKTCSKKIRSQYRMIFFNFFHISYFFSTSLCLFLRKRKQIWSLYFWFRVVSTMNGIYQKEWHHNIDCQLSSKKVALGSAITWAVSFDLKTTFKLVTCSLSKTKEH